MEVNKLLRPEEGKFDRSLGCVFSLIFMYQIFIFVSLSNISFPIAEDPAAIE